MYIHTLNYSAIGIGSWVGIGFKVGIGSWVGNWATGETWGVVAAGAFGGRGVRDERRDALWWQARVCASIIYIYIL